MNTQNKLVVRLDFDYGVSGEIFLVNYSASQYGQISLYTFNGMD